MNKGVDQVTVMLQQGIAWIINFFKFVWQWSFGQVMTMTKLLPNFSTLPIWKQITIVVVGIALAYLIYVVATDLWSAVRKILEGFIGLLSAILRNIYYVAIAGAIAFGGAWAVNTLRIPWLP